MVLVGARTHRGSLRIKPVLNARLTVEFSGRVFQMVDSLLMVQANSRVPLRDNTYRGNVLLQERLITPKMLHVLSVIMSLQMFEHKVL